MIENSGGVSNVDKIAVGHIKQLLIKVLTPVIKNMTNPPDYMDDYKAEYGSYLGPALVSAVAKARTQPSTPATVSSTVPSSSIGGMTATINRNVSTPSIVQQVCYSYSLFI